MILALPLIAAILFDGPQSSRDAAIGKREQTSVAVTTGCTPSDHNQCQYEFEVGGREFTGRSSSPTYPTALGAHLPVYFDPQNPATNSLRDFTEATASERSMALLCISGICLLAIIILIAKRAARPHS
jgi:hypothetical protein